MSGLCLHRPRPSGARVGRLMRQPSRSITGVLKQLALAQRTSGADYQQAMFDRTILFRRVQALLQRGDTLAMPTISRTALPIEQDLFGAIEIDDEVFNDVRPNWFPWTMPFNRTGHPAVS